MTRMNTDGSERVLPGGDVLIHRELTEQVIGTAMEVHNNLGSGFLEKVYENAMVVELRLRGLKAEQQKPITAYYKGVVVGDYIADLLVNDTVLVELKTVAQLLKIHQLQVLNYLKSSHLTVGLLINFHGSRLEWNRVVG